MTKLIRTIAGASMVEGILACLWADHALRFTSEPHEITVVVNQTLGGTMGGFLALSSVLLLLARRDDLAAGRCGRRGQSVA